MAKRHLNYFLSNYYLLICYAYFYVHNEPRNAWYFTCIIKNNIYILPRLRDLIKLMFNFGILFIHPFIMEAVVVRCDAALITDTL